MAYDKEQNFFKRATSLSDLDDMSTPATSFESTFKKPELDFDIPKQSDFAEAIKETPVKKELSVEKKAPRVNSASKKGTTVKKIASEAVKILDSASLKSFSDEIRSTIAESRRQKFTVAVVGEFSRGKSTFINKLLEKDILPVANMPTTAILTRIRYSAKEGITIYDADKNTKSALPLSADSWKNYVADDEGNDPNGVAFVNLNSPWLESGIEIIDTPGAGDLEAGRARLIGDALKSSDSAIITISALSALSMSEKLFIEERLISKKTPFLMLIVTKLDQVDLAQRSGVIDYIKEKLKMWKFDGINVYIPYDIEMPDSRHDSIIGMDKITDQINAWIFSSERKALTEQWTALKLKSHLTSVIDFAKEQKCITDEKDREKQAQLLEKKQQMIDKAEQAWDDAKMQMIKKGDECYDLFVNKVNDFKSTLTEKLQYEISHISNPQKWWNEDFPYKLKIEMTNLSNIIENLVSRAYTKDTAWFNATLEKNFKTSVLVSADEVTDREVYTTFDSFDDVNVGDLTKSRNLSRIGLTALSIGAAMVCSTIGIMPIFATMGIGTGGSILSETIFKNKAESQKKILKDEIQIRIPKIVDNATSYSEVRIKAMYNNVIKEATKQQENWVASQMNVIASASEDDSAKKAFDPDELIRNMVELCDKIDSIYPC